VAQARYLSADDLVQALKLVCAGQYNGKPLFFWLGKADRLRQTIGAAPEFVEAMAWLDTNELAEDVIPRLARETLKSKLVQRIQTATASNARILVVVNPYLLLRYEPAPLAIFWNSFVDSRHAVVVVLPTPVPRPVDLPPYVRFRGDTPEQIFLEANEGAAVVSPDGGATSC